MTSLRVLLTADSALTGWMNTVLPQSLHVWLAQLHVEAPILAERIRVGAENRGSSTGPDKLDKG